MQNSCIVAKGEICLTSVLWGVPHTSSLLTLNITRNGAH